MADVFISKVRRVGTSLGVIIPRSIIKQEGLEAGCEVQLGIATRDPKRLAALFGSAKGASSFVRNHASRV